MGDREEAADDWLIGKGEMSSEKPDHQSLIEEAKNEIVKDDSSYSLPSSFGAETPPIVHIPSTDSANKALMW